MLGEYVPGALSALLSGGSNRTTAIPSRKRVKKEKVKAEPIETGKSSMFFGEKITFLASAPPPKKKKSRKWLENEEIPSEIEPIAGLFDKYEAKTPEMPVGSEILEYKPKLEGG